MVTTIRLNPITRISGFMEIEVKVEDHKIISAKSSGLLFRGFEHMLLSRSPLDAVYFTERICGICSTAHSMASTLALESAFNVSPSENDRMLRDVIHGFEFIQNHIRHFYLYTLPDFALTPDIQPVYSLGNYDLRLPEYLNSKLAKDYLEAIKLSGLSHKALAILGGKAPHNHGIFLGGVTESMNISRLVELNAIVSKLKAFINDIMLEDVYIIADYYNDYFSIGVGPKNLMSFGVFDHYIEKDLTYVYPSIMTGGNTSVLDSSKITEDIYSSWYSSDTIPDTEKEGSYSWIKSPRYNNKAFEVGPLARMILSFNYENKISAMDRTIARVLEAKKIISIIEALLQRVTFEKVNQKAYEIPESSKGVGLTDTTRGALGHWLSIKNKVIDHYNIITPSAWNASPRDADNVAGPIETALIGTPIEDLNKPVEIGRVVRSFDPCVSCATHVISNYSNPIEILI